MKIKYHFKTNYDNLLEFSLIIENKYLAIFDLIDLRAG